MIGAIMTENGRSRVIINAVQPEIDCGRFPIKRTVGEQVTVEADVFADGHDVIGCVLLFRADGEEEWSRTPMSPLVNDRWRGAFAVGRLGFYYYTIHAWIDPFQSWVRDMRKRIAAGQKDLAVEMHIGAILAETAVKRAEREDAPRLARWITRLKSGSGGLDTFLHEMNNDLVPLMSRYPQERFPTRYGKELTVWVDRPLALFGAWYEMFPRSCAPEPGRHGTLRDCEERLRYVADMGFDVLYLPPIHPIGRTFRKGRNNAPTATEADVGSPWAIGAAEGGHKAIHPELGTLADFQRLVAKAREHGLEIAVDLAFQCSADHPYVKEHPNWFRRRPDGTIQYAENPPKKYEDIYPLDFETDDWRELWQELKSVVTFWMDQGVRIFRVDNPHTKALPFWEWLIGEVRRADPTVIFLAEAFTRPKLMGQLAKLGFTQSYTYFTWRNTRWELTEYLLELTRGDAKEYLRPNLWPNTPDILPEYLQAGGRPAFMARLILAATLVANYGIYGPAFELCENAPREPGSEEYLHSEKYEIRHWDLEAPHSLRGLITRVNRIRRENPALQSNEGLRFHHTDNDYVICYSKSTEDKDDIVVCPVNLDPHHTHSAWIELPLHEFGLRPDEPYQVHDLLSGARYLWSGARNFVQLDPRAAPGHILRIRRRVRTERDFDYFM
jgi:starch synthase (maltosyl-transferring)